MNILITGGSGFIGKHLTAALQQQGHFVKILSRHAPKHGGDFYLADLEQETIPSKVFKDIDAVIHLAGKNIFGRWTKKFKDEIYSSRINGTKNLVFSLQQSPHKPKVLISASGTGYYGDRGEEELTEDSGPGNDFLANVCVEWEQTAQQLNDWGIRVATVRTAPVLGEQGQLKQLLPIYKLGLGGAIGWGKQWYPWIHIDDIVGTYLFALAQEHIQGPINACAPELVRNKQFSDTLAKVLNRPAILPVPKFVLRLLFNDLADAISVSEKVIPQKLTNAGYQFHFPTLEPTLRNLLQKT